MKHSNHPISLRYKLFLLLAVFFLHNPQPVCSQTLSNAGMEFWTVFPVHVPNGDPRLGVLELAKFSVFVTSPKASSGTVSVGKFIAHFNVSPNAITEIVVPREEAYINDFDGAKVLTNRGIHIVVDPGHPPIAAYAHIFAGARSAATLLLPVAALGQRYYAVSWPQSTGDDGDNFIVAVATEPNTRIHIRQSGVDIIPGGILLPNIGDAYQYTAYSVSGMEVSVDTLSSACNHFALFTGSSGVEIRPAPCKFGDTLDPLFQQAIPVESWGYDYGFIPFSQFSPKFSYPVRTEGQFLRVIAKENGTVISIGGKVTATLNAGEVFTSQEPPYFIHDAPLKTPVMIHGSKPIMAAQFSLTQVCDLDPSYFLKRTSYGDPDMVILNPVEYGIRDITLYSATREAITEQYINILIKTAAAASFRVNGKVHPGTFSPMPGNSDFSYIQLNLNQDSTNVYHLTADDTFNAVAYGFGNVESYSYSAGTNFATLASLSTIRTSTALPIDSACVEDDYFFKLVLPFRSPRISWRMGGGAVPVIQEKPEFTTLLVAGTPAYIYSLPKTPEMITPGNYALKVVADYPGTIGGCSNGGSEITGNLLVITPAAVRISATVADCGNAFKFTDESLDGANAVISRVWDFGEKDAGDANTSTLKAPVHTYAATGNYRISLTVINASGCQSTGFQQITVSKSIAAGFTGASTACRNDLLLFTDTSRSDSFITAGRKWFFGDGDSSEVRTGESVTHRYPKAGQYRIKMLLTSVSGCRSDTAFKEVIILNKYVPEFKTGGVCLADAFAQFSNLTPVAAADSAKTSFRWSFGDSFATAANPDTSSLSDPQHRYTAPGSYRVTLVVVSPGGCADTLTKMIMINGVILQARFEIQGPARFCSGQPLTLHDLSTLLDFGSVNKLEWQFDALNHPEKKLLIDSLRADGIYNTSYILPAGTDSATYVIKLLAYSGKICADSFSKAVTVFRLPAVHFDALPEICTTDRPFVLLQAAESGGLAGSGRFSGPGVSSSGNFAPQLSGPGLHQILYTFTTALGCSDTVSQIIRVLQSPTVNLPAEVLTSPGNAIALNPAQMLGNFTYRWSPASGLNRVDIANPVASPTENTVYHLTVSNGSCSVTGTVLVSVAVFPKVTNTFTPNGDGINDQLEITNISMYSDAVIEIFNRYGSPVFRSIGYGKRWDGRYQGREVPSGIYYYSITLKKQQKPLSGYITLLR